MISLVRIADKKPSLAKDIMSLIKTKASNLNIQEMFNHYLAQKKDSWLFKLYEKNQQGLFEI
ncbi:MAG: hypothetical protein VW378_04615 [bacterium]